MNMNVWKSEFVSVKNANTDIRIPFEYGYQIIRFSVFPSDFRFIFDTLLYPQRIK